MAQSLAKDNRRGDKTSKPLLAGAVITFQVIIIIALIGVVVPGDNVAQYLHGEGTPIQIYYSVALLLKGY